MKKITNNAPIGKLTWLLNIFVLIFFILTMVFLMRFDKTNVEVVATRDAYQKADDNVKMLEHPMRQYRAEVDYYQYKLDTLRKRVVKTRDEKKMKEEQIAVTAETLKSKSETLAKGKSDLSEARAAFAPMKASWDELNARNGKNRSKAVAFALLTLALFIAKTAVFATWNYRNSQNIHAIAPWMKDGMPTWWAYVCWLIPVYNLIKPFSFMREIWEETDYALEDKAIVMTDKNRHVDNSGLYLGIWWALFIISVWIMNAILLMTFFGEGAFFQKVGHGSTAVAACVIMFLCMLVEFFLIKSYNKKNRKIVENADKFVNNAVGGKNSGTAAGNGK